MVEETTLGDAMIVATTGDINRTLSPQTILADKRLKRFLE
jgi:hypothetical protein